MLAHRTREHQDIMMLLLIGFVFLTSLAAARSGYRPNQQYSSYPQPTHHHKRVRPYQFNYAVKGHYGELDYGRREEQNGEGRVHGTYRVLLPDGRVQTVKYTADHDGGYRADVVYEGEPQQHPSPPSYHQQHPSPPSYHQQHPSPPSYHQQHPSPPSYHQQHPQHHQRAQLRRSQDSKQHFKAGPHHRTISHHRGHMMHGRHHNSPTTHSAMPPFHVPLPKTTMSSAASSQDRVTPGHDMPDVVVDPFMEMPEGSGDLDQEEQHTLHF